MGSLIKKLKCYALSFVWICLTAFGVMVTGDIARAEELETTEPEGVEVTAATFPDPQVRKALMEYVYVGDDFKVYIDSEYVESLYFADEVTDITGLSIFPNLQYLTLMNYAGTEISIQNEGLKELVIGGNKEELVVDAPSITVLKVYGNGKVKSVDVTKAGNVEELEVCYDDSVNEVKGLSSLTKLESLSLYDYPGETIDLTGLEKLEMLSFQGGKLTNIDVSRLTELYELNVYMLGITSLDVSENSSLKSLDCCCCDNLAELKVPGSVVRLYCYGNKLTSLDVSSCRNLYLLCADDNKLTSLDVSKCTALESLAVKNNMIKSLYVSKCRKLGNLCVDNNKLKSIDISKCRKLTGLSVSGNKKLSRIDISKNKKLSDLDISNTRIKKLDTHKNKELLEVDFHNTLISKVDFSKNKKIYLISYYGSALKKYDLSQINSKYFYVLYTAKRGSKIKLKNYIGKGYNVVNKPYYLKYNKKKREITIPKKFPEPDYTADDYDLFLEDDEYQELVLEKDNRQIVIGIYIK